MHATTRAFFAFSSGNIWASSLSADVVVVVAVVADVEESIEEVVTDWVDGVEADVVVVVDDVAVDVEDVDSAEVFIEPEKDADPIAISESTTITIIG